MDTLLRNIHLHAPIQPPADHARSPTLKSVDNSPDPAPQPLSPDALACHCGPTIATKGSP